MAQTLLISGALILVFEGALYALFPHTMQRMMLQIIATASENLRRAGLVMALAGLLLLYFLTRS